MFSKTVSLVSLFLLSFLVLSCGTTDEGTMEDTTPEPGAMEETPDVAETEPAKAVARLEPTEGNTASGVVTFEQMNGTVRIVADISGLEPGAHGFHIHETGDCSAPDATSAGGHFNPQGYQHGAPDAAEHHAGDLGNIEASEDGTAHLELEVDYLTLTSGETSVMDKAVIVHSDPDDFTSQPTGNAGSRLACGVIETDTGMREGS